MSSEAISAAQAAVATSAVPVVEKEQRDEQSSAVLGENEWLPEELRRASKGAAKARKGKKRR